MSVPPSSSKCARSVPAAGRIRSNNSYVRDDLFFGPSPVFCRNVFRTKTPQQKKRLATRGWFNPRSVVSAKYAKGHRALSKGLDQAKIKFLAVDNKTGLNRRSMKATNLSVCGRKSMWQHEMSAAPFNRDLELAVIDASGEHTILFPCRRVVGGWIKAATQRRINFHPTHWREWATA
jgi:hypothetical protein